MVIHTLNPSPKEEEEDGAGDNGDAAAYTGDCGRTIYDLSHAMMMVAWMTTKRS